MITVNLNKAKEIAHSLRRADRDEKMKPLDIEATIPAMATEAENKRQVIRDANAVIQSQINAATNEVELKELIDQL